MNELTREQIVSMPPWIEYQENDRSIESHVKHLITADGDVWLGQRYRTNYGSRHYAWHVLIRDEWQEINGITHWSPINLPKDEERGLWKQELVWVARNDRGDIIRAQDDHPSVAIKATERITKVSRGEKNDEG